MIEEAEKENKRRCNKISSSLTLNSNGAGMIALLSKSPKSIIEASVGNRRTMKISDLLVAAPQKSAHKKCLKRTTDIHQQNKSWKSCICNDGMRSGGFGGENYEATESTSAHFCAQNNAKSDRSTKSDRVIINVFNIYLIETATKERRWSFLLSSLVVSFCKLDNIKPDAGWLR